MIVFLENGEGLGEREEECCVFHLLLGSYNECRKEIW